MDNNDKKTLGAIGKLYLAVALVAVASKGIVMGVDAIENKSEQNYKNSLTYATSTIDDITFTGSETWVKTHVGTDTVVLNINPYNENSGTKNLPDATNYWDRSKKLQDFNYLARPSNEITFPLLDSWKKNNFENVSIAYVTLNANK